MIAKINEQVEINENINDNIAENKQELK